MPEIDNWQVCGIDSELGFKIFNPELKSCLIYVLAQCLTALPSPRVSNIISIFKNGKENSLNL